MRIADADGVNHKRYGKDRAAAADKAKHEADQRASSSPSKMNERMQMQKRMKERFYRIRM
jgi:hypothetical protein